MCIVLKTKRLILRPLEMEDLLSLHRYSSDTENTKYMLYLPYDSLEESKGFLINAINQWQKEKPKTYEFAIILDNIHIGGISLFIDYENNEAEIGWVIDSKYQKKGYTSEAAIALKDFVFNKLKFKRLIACCDSRNIASYKTMEKIGMKFERDNGIRYNRGSDEPVKELLYSIEI